MRILLKNNYLENYNSDHRKDIFKSFLVSMAGLSAMEN